MATIAEREAAVFLHLANRQPVTLVRGQGCRVWDDQGNSYLDFVAGIAALSLGHCHPKVTEAIKTQAEQLVHVSNFFYTKPQIELAELLVQQTGLQKVFFCNSGAEAVEGSLKLARKWGREKKNGAHEIITMDGAFHGRTMGALAVTSNPRYREPFQPLVPGIMSAPYNNIEALRAAMTDRTCAIILEPIQGEGGVNIPDPEYLPAVRKLCDEANVVLIIDEVQTGAGRTGNLFAYQHYPNLKPDILALAKGLGSGVPVGAFVAAEKVAIFEPGDHGSTFGGQPLTTAAALAVMRTLVAENIPAQAAKRGEYLTSKLRSLEDRHPSITSVRGQGLLLAIEFGSETAAQVMNATRERGLLINNLRPNLLRIAPPLIISEAEIDEAVRILDEAIGAVERSQEASSKGAPPAR